MVWKKKKLVNLEVTQKLRKGEQSFLGDTLS